MEMIEFERTEKGKYTTAVFLHQGTTYNVNVKCDTWVSTAINGDWDNRSSSNPHSRKRTQEELDAIKLLEEKTGIKYDVTK
jgi:hypothetical protein